MKPSNHFSKATIFLAIGFAMGLGAANFFAAGGNEGKPTVPPFPATPKAPRPYVPSAARETPKTPTANCGSANTLAEERIGANTVYEDITLSETVDANWDEADATVPPPEELAKNQPADRPATSHLSPQETDELESKLLLESENAAPNPLEGDEGLLEHERR